MTRLPVVVGCVSGLIAGSVVIAQLGGVDTAGAAAATIVAAGIVFALASLTVERWLGGRRHGSGSTR